ncbi:uncharacterized protein EDB91DRAFT_1078524 [Suillus paluster]|uniref:uncharacterized protein n=1 Tax=Suillus paluster TaxID=48578 RepID=UPI001B86E3D0|nr:uncharacterized protein EDB91DRAFT_1078524 [Suillus paluster]KAG1750503.1 hypothetical protein EDB91DRAFT_1078524 [Suillus paluster]
MGSITLCPALVRQVEPDPSGVKASSEVHRIPSVLTLNQICSAWQKIFCGLHHPQCSLLPAKSNAFLPTCEYFKTSPGADREVGGARYILATHFHETHTKVHKYRRRNLKRASAIFGPVAAVIKFTTEKGKRILLRMYLSPDKVALRPLNRDIDKFESRIVSKLVPHGSIVTTFTR